MYPVLFQVFGFSIDSYPVVIFISIIASSTYLLYSSMQKKMPLEFLYDYFIIITLVTFSFARLGGIFENISFYTSDVKQIFNLIDGAYNLYSGLIGFFLIFGCLCSLKRQSFGQWLDIF